MLTPEAIDKLGIKIYGSTFQANTPPSFKDMRSFITYVLLIRNRQTGHRISRWVLEKYEKSSMW